MEIEEQREHPNLVATVWKLLPTDPIAAYAKSGHPYAQYYYLRRNIDNPEVPLQEKVQMMQNVIKFHVAPNLIDNFSLVQFYQLADTEIFEHLFRSGQFEEKLNALEHPEIYCRLFFIYCIYLKRLQHCIQNRFLVFLFAKYLESIDKPEIYAEIIEIIEFVCPDIAMSDLGKIYRIVFKNESQLQHTLLYLQNTTGVTDEVKVGSITEFAYVTALHTTLIESIWQRCINEGHIRNYEVLVALAMKLNGQSRDQTQWFIHQNFPHLLYGPITHYSVDNPQLALILLTNPRHLRALAPDILVSFLRGPLITNLPTDAIRAVLQAILEADLSQDLHCELLFQILNHIVIPVEDSSALSVAERNEIFKLILCDIKLLLEIQTEYPAKVRYFAFISAHLFSCHSIATMIISVIDKDIVLKRLCNTIPRFNEIIIELAVIEGNQAKLSPAERQQNKANYQPKTKFAFDEATHQPEFKQRDNHASIIQPPIAKSTSMHFTPIDTAKILAGSPAFREIQARNFPARKASNEPVIALQGLFKDRKNFLPALNSEQSLQELQEMGLKLIEQVPAEEINRLLDGQQAVLATQVLFALVEILQLPYPLVSYYFNGQYEHQHNLELSRQNVESPWHLF